MFHVTRCPNCRTSFRVTDAHLAAFDGKVRCGRCAFVFDAREQFVGEAPPEAAPAPAPVPAPAAAPVAASPAPAVARKDDDDAYGIDSITQQLGAAAEAEHDHSATLTSQSLQHLASVLAQAAPAPAPAARGHAMMELDLDTDGAGEAEHHPIHRDYVDAPPPESALHPAAHVAEPAHVAAPVEHDLDLDIDHPAEPAGEQAAPSVDDPYAHLAHEIHEEIVIVAPPDHDEHDEPLDAHLDGHPDALLVGHQSDAHHDAHPGEHEAHRDYAHEEAQAQASFDKWAAQLALPPEPGLPKTEPAPVEDHPDEHPAAHVDDTGSGYRPILTAEDEAMLRVPSRPSPWRWLWSIPSLLAVILLVGQVALRYRTELSVQLPGLRPRLVRLCELTGCRLELPARSEWLHTDWSELKFAPDHPNIIQVDATLRNQAPFEQALPQMELTLTDDLDRVVAKKVFAPRAFLAPLADGSPAPLPASLAPNGDLHAFLQLDLGTLHSSGYSINWVYARRN